MKWLSDEKGSEKSCIAPPIGTSTASAVFLLPSYKQIISILFPGAEVHLFHQIRLGRCVDEKDDVHLSVAMDIKGIGPTRLNRLFQVYSGEGRLAAKETRPYNIFELNDPKEERTPHWGRLH